MKKTVFNFLLLAGILLLAGCQKEARIGGKDAIQFSAASPGTKTAYSGQPSAGKEGIYWIEWDETANTGDIVRIFSNKAVHRYNKDADTGAPQPWADYVIKDVSNDGALSKGKIDNVPGDGTGNGLIWKEAGDYEFFAVYPNLESPEGYKGIINASIPQNQAISVDLTDRAVDTPDMSYAVMTAFQKQTTSVDGEGDPIRLEFNPAFTAFEFTFNSDIPLQIWSFKLMSDGTSPKISGDYAIKYVNGVPTYDCTSAGGQVVNAAFSARSISIDESTSYTFDVFALPQKLSGLTIEFTVFAEGWTSSETRRLKLNYKDGSPVEFDKCLKHSISGTIQGDWSFKYITMTGEVIEWTDKDVAVVTDDTPQSTQFTVNGVQNVYQIHNEEEPYKKLRQTWVLGDATATVSFKVFSPVNGTYEVKPFVKKADNTIVEGSTGFTVEGTLSGNIGGTDHEHYATMVEFTVKANSPEAGDQLFFKTFVTEGGTTYSLDSETQLYDARGYHYFVETEPSL